MQVPNIFDSNLVALYNLFVWANITALSSVIIMLLLTFFKSGESIMKVFRFIFVTSLAFDIMMAIAIFMRLIVLSSLN